MFLVLLQFTDKFDELSIVQKKYIMLRFLFIYFSINLFFMGQRGHFPTMWVLVCMFFFWLEELLGVVHVVGIVYVYRRYPFARVV